MHGIVIRLWGLSVVDHRVESENSGGETVRVCSFG